MNMVLPYTLAESAIRLFASRSFSCLALRMKICKRPMMDQWPLNESGTVPDNSVTCTRKSASCITCHCNIWNTPASQTGRFLYLGHHGAWYKTLLERSKYYSSAHASTCLILTLSRVFLSPSVHLSLYSFAGQQHENYERRHRYSAYDR